MIGPRTANDAKCELLRAALFHTPRNPFRESAALEAISDGGLLIENGRRVAGYGVTGRSAADALGRVGNEDVNHLRGSDAIDYFDAGRLFEQLTGPVRQRFAGGNTGAQRR